MAEDHEYRYFVHGVDVHVQDEPNRADGIRRNSQGTRIRQNSGGNWFHLAIPTPTFLDNHVVNYRDAALRGKINGQATIRKVHIWMGGVPRGRRIFKKDYSRDEALSNRVLLEAFGISEGRCEEPLVMCIYVEFENGGEITFGGAGVRFDEQR
jgi:hypothetical protein